MKRRINNIMEYDLNREGKGIFDQHYLTKEFAGYLYEYIQRNKPKIFKKRLNYWKKYPNEQFGKHMIDHMRKEGGQCCILGMNLGHGDK